MKGYVIQASWKACVMLGLVRMKSREAWSGSRTLYSIDDRLYLFFQISWQSSFSPFRPLHGIHINYSM